MCKSANINPFYFFINQSMSFLNGKDIFWVFIRNNVFRKNDKTWKNKRLQWWQFLAWLYSLNISILSLKIYVWFLTFRKHIPVIQMTFDCFRSLKAKLGSLIHVLLFLLLITLFNDCVYTRSIKRIISSPWTFFGQQQWMQL